MNLETRTLFNQLGSDLIEFHKNSNDPSGIWDEYIGAHIDENILNSAIKFTSNADFQSAINSSDIENELKEQFNIVISQSQRSEIFDQLLISPHLKVIYDLLLLSIGALPAEANEIFVKGEVTVSSQLLHFCKDIIVFLLKQNLESELKSRDEVLELAIVLQVFDSFESVLLDIGAFGHNYLPLCGISNWMSDITELVDEYLEPKDIEYLEQVFKTTPLVALHTKKLDPAWLSRNVLQGNSMLINNPYIPAETVNKCLENLDYRQQNLLFHPNANKSNALSVALELLEDGDELSYLQEWTNVRDDGFNGFNNFRTSDTATFVIDGILEWCDEDPDERSEIAEIFEN